MKKLLLIFSIISFLFPEVNATWKEKSDTLLNFTKERSMKKISIQNLKYNNEKKLDHKQSSDHILYSRILIHKEPLISITKFPTENRLIVERFSKLSNSFVVDIVEKFLMIPTGKNFIGVTMQNSLILTPTMNDFMFKTNIWYSFGRTSFDHLTGTISREYFNTHYLIPYKKR